jgi:phosphate uptake regulator
MASKVHSIQDQTLSREDLRRVQRTGQSSLAVTLPKTWTEAFGLRAGSELRFRDLGEGRLELTVVGQGTTGTPAQKVLTFDATEVAPHLVGRLLVGAYITGQDVVVLTGREPLAPPQLDHVREVVRRTVGAAIVSEEPTRVEIQIFVDPTKHRLPSLMEHLVRMILQEIEACEKGMVDGDPSGLATLDFIEDEIDRFYLLIVRQLLLASEDFRVAREVGVASHHYQLGDRLVAKMLEVLGDLVYKVGKGIEEDLESDSGLSAASRSDLVRMLEMFADLLTRTMKAFGEVSAADADATLEDLRRALDESARLSENLVRRSSEKLAAVRLQRVVTHLTTALETLRVINEVTINRSVEPENTRSAPFIVGRASPKG